MGYFLALFTIFSEKSSVYYHIQYILFQTYFAIITKPLKTVKIFLFLKFFCPEPAFRTNFVLEWVPNFHIKIHFHGFEECSV